MKANPIKYVLFFTPYFQPSIATVSSSNNQVGNQVRLHSHHSSYHGNNLALTSFNASHNQVRPRALQSDGLQVTIDGETTGITGVVSYDPGQDINDNNVNPFEISPGGSQVTLNGNSWKAFELPMEYDIKENTLLEFNFSLVEETEWHAICLDDRVDNWRHGLCFTLAGTEYSGGTTWEGEAMYYSLPVGHFADFFQKEIKYIAFVQDSDANRADGTSSFSDIELRRDLTAPSLTISRNGNIEGLEFVGSYKGGQDVGQDMNTANVNPFEISSDGSQVTFNGNSWKAFELRADYKIKESTLLEFDFSLVEEAEVHSICLDDRVSGGYDDEMCFKIAGTDSDGTIREGESSHFSFPVGHFASLYQKEIRYIAFVHDNDANRGEGISTFSNIELSDLTAPSLKISRNGNMEPLEFIGSYKGSQDINKNINPFEISSDGSQVTFNGNSWKAFELRPEYEVKENTLLEFNFSLVEEAELHSICLDDRIDGGYDADMCFSLAGTDADVTSIREGDTLHYSFPVGHFASWLHKEIKYIAFLQDNDANHGDGVSTFSNIEIKDFCQSVSDCTENYHVCVEGAGYCACADNYFGQTCGTFCDDTTCSNDGECDSLGACICPDPWTGETCAECTLGLYGDDCSVECGPANCPDGTCDPDGNCCENSCENGGTFIAGSASGCECLCSDLWTGETCTECAPGRYGDDCVVECGPDNCANGTCDPDGNCVCSGPWTGETCAECIPGRYGDDCMVECGPDNCPAGTCDNNGNCVPNCENNCENGGTLSGGTDCECLCSGPWTGETCAECIPGRYGEDCSVECGQESCPDGTCDDNGSCIPSCNLVCSNDGVLLQQVCQCICAENWSGEDCSINTTPVDTEEVSTSTNTSITISLGDVDPDAVEIVDPPLNGNVTIEDDGSLTYMPNPGFQGTDEFTTQTCDENNDCTRMNFLVSVTSPLESQVSQGGDDKNLDGLYALISLVLAPILWLLQEPLKRWYDKRYRTIDDKATHAASSSSASVPITVNVKAKGSNNNPDIDLESGVQNITSNTKGRPPDADFDSEVSEEWSTGDDDENDDDSSSDSNSEEDDSSSDDSISEEDDDSNSDGDESDSEDEEEDISDEDWED